MAQIILTFGLEKEKLRAVRNSASNSGMLVKEISRINYRQKLGFLAGIQGFHKERTNYIGPDLSLIHI